MKSNEILVDFSPKYLAKSISELVKMFGGTEKVDKSYALMFSFKDINDIYFYLKNIDVEDGPKISIGTCNVHVETLPTLEFDKDNQLAAIIATDSSENMSDPNPLCYVLICRKTQEWMSFGMIKVKDSDTDLIKCETVIEEFKPVVDMYRKYFGEGIPVYQSFQGNQFIGFGTFLLCVINTNNMLVTAHNVVDKKANTGSALDIVGIYSETFSKGELPYPGEGYA